MTQVNVLDVVQNTQEANPYNKNKPWQQGQENGNTANADSMFFEDKTAPRQPVAEPVTQTTEAQPSQEHDWEKRYKDLKPHHDKTVTELRAEIAALKTGAAPTTQGEASQTAAPVQGTELEERIKALEKEKFEAQKVAARELLAKVHPDYKEVVNSTEFSEWKNTQEKQIKDWIDDNPTNGSLAVAALDLYKAYASKKAQMQESNKVQKTLAEGADSLVSTRSTEGVQDSRKKIWTAKEIASLSINEYEKYSDEIDRAQLEGRIRK